MALQGYIRFPTIHNNSIVFVAEDDLWQVSSTGGRAERLTAGAGATSYPRFSPDGAWLAFLGAEEGPEEVFVMAAEGSEAQRLTFQGANRIAGWSQDSTNIIFASSSNSPHQREDHLHSVRRDGGEVQKLPYGLANAIDFGPEQGIILGRNIREPARWKRYRGGRTGHFWIDPQGTGEFQRLLQLNGDLASPYWVGNRIYFLSDHEGVGNIYSCTPSGEDLQKHSEHNTFYARNLSSDGTRLVYHAGADLYVFDPQSQERPQKLEISLGSTRTQLNCKFVSPTKYLTEYTLHPEGFATTVVARGKPFTFGNWEGSVLQLGIQDGVRYRLLSWLADGKRLVGVHNVDGQEELVVLDESGMIKSLAGVDFGHALDLVVAPNQDLVAIANQRNELILIDLEEGRHKVLDRSEYAPMNGMAWSPEGAWLAYGFALSPQRTAIKLFSGTTLEMQVITNPILHDKQPAFDPDGKYLYFIGQRSFVPMQEHLEFGWAFPRGEKPYAIMLRKDLRSPFVALPKIPGLDEKNEKNNDGKEKDEKANENGKNGENGAPNSAPKPLIIDLEGIERRIVPFPIAEGLYRQVRGIKGKVLLLNYPPFVPQEDRQGERPGVLGRYDFETLKYEILADGVNSFDLSRDGKTLIYKARGRLRVVKASDKITRSDNGEKPNRESGWLDLNRIKISVQPQAEWRQMFAEAWRLQRDYFWTEDMSGINWQEAFERYAPLVSRVGSRSELSDLFYEMLGELGTSHAYEIGGEYRSTPNYSQGYLGVDWSYDSEHDQYRIARIITGDPADSKESSPLLEPGLNVREGDIVLAINGQRVTRVKSPQSLLVNQAGNEVQINIKDGETGEVRSITARALSNEGPARYREWVEQNRRTVHEQSAGKVGYIHIPDMASPGFAEFHRSYLAEYDYPTLLIDVRWNRGGSVSGLILSRLTRTRLGYDFPRWTTPVPYPWESPRGPMVALTNEHAGSDGDMFCHSFKLLGLGPLIGKRTWGGVIGMAHNHQLVDGTVITEPEYSFWFKDVGWNVENYGTDPDIEVDITPQDYSAGRDSQLARALAEALQQLERTSYLEPKPGDRPKLGR